MFINIILFLTIIALKTSIAAECPLNCLYCKDENTCTRCETNYVLVGTSQFDLTNDTITCELPSNFPEAYFESPSGVHYPCSNSDYGYLRADTSKCYRKDVLGINNYYTTNSKNYYPCDSTDSSDSNNIIQGIEFCNECKLNGYNLNCISCIYGYAFKDGDTTQCLSKDTLSQDITLFKYDENNYRSCSVIDNCYSCSSRHVCTGCVQNYYLKNFEGNKCYLTSEITPIDEYYLENGVYFSCGINGGIANCIKCNGDKNHCTECHFDYTILNDDDTKCVKRSGLSRKLYYTHNGGLNYYSCINYDDNNNDNKHCLECDFSDASNFKCLKCNNSYYFLEDQGDICKEESTITKNYYKYNSTLYKLCSNAINDCSTCNNSKICLTCSTTGFGILDNDFSRCQDISQGLIDEYIYMEQENDLYYTCEKEINGCKKCEGKNLCKETISDEYCLLENENGNGNSVYKLNTSSDEYYFSNSDYKCIDCENIFPNCHLCKPGGVCIQCEEGYSLIDEAGCDYTAAYEIDDEYFSADNFINFYKCDNTALSAKAISNCERCKFSLETKQNSCIQCSPGYIILDNNDFLCIYITNLIQYQIDNNKIIQNELDQKYYTCSKLMENCDACENMEECSTCKDNYVFLNDNKTICYLRDTFINGHYFTNDGGVNYYSCIDNCLSCNDSTHCITCDKGYELNDFNTKCILILKNDKE